jgi:hypothetical protein
MKGTEVVGVLQYIKVTVQRKGWVVGGRFDRAIHPSAKESESYSSIISHSDEEKPLNFKVKKDLQNRSSAGSRAHVFRSADRSL